MPFQATHSLFTAIDFEDWNRPGLAVPQPSCVGQQCRNTCRSWNDDQSLFGAVTMLNVRLSACRLYNDGNPRMTVWGIGCSPSSRQWTPVAITTSQWRQSLHVRYSILSGRHCCYTRLVSNISALFYLHSVIPVSPAACCLQIVIYIPATGYRIPNTYEKLGARV